MALQTLLREYTEVTKSPKENKMYSQLQPAKMRPRRKARKFLYAIGFVSHLMFQHVTVEFKLVMLITGGIYYYHILSWQEATPVYRAAAGVIAGR